MHQLIVSLSPEQKESLLYFLLSHPDILHWEHYVHTHSPLDNLEHYMWEELHEHVHRDILIRYQFTHQLSNDDFNLWISQELNEQRF